MPGFEEVHPPVIGRIAELCANMSDPDFDPLAEQYGAADAVRRIVDKVRCGKPTETEADLDEVDDAFVHEGGIAGVTNGNRVYSKAPGGLPGHPEAHVYECPAASPCARRVVRVADGQAPECAILKSPLRGYKVGG